MQTEIGLHFFFAPDKSYSAYSCIKEEDHMCRRTILVGAAVAAVGVGLIVSCLIDAVLLRILIGAALVGAGLILSNRR